MKEQMLDEDPPKRKAWSVDSSAYKSKRKAN